MQCLCAEFTHTRVKEAFHQDEVAKPALQLVAAAE
jgi:hypothetical protein